MSRLKLVEFILKEEEEGVGEGWGEGWGNLSTLEEYKYLVWSMFCNITDFTFRVQSTETG